MSAASNTKNLSASLQEKLNTVLHTLEQTRIYENACHILTFDLETLCPAQAMENQGATISFLENQAFRLKKDPVFTEAVSALYENIRELEKEAPLYALMIRILHREDVKSRNITPELQHSYSTAFNKSYIDWLEAKKASDFSIFAPSLTKVRDISLEQISLRPAEETSAGLSAYDILLSDYERGMTSSILDQAFSRCRERLLPLLERIRKSDKKIRRDFLTTPVSDEQQRRMTEYILDIMGYDRSRGAWAITEHPFTDEMAAEDVRITTHFDPHAFASSMYSVIHEGGHALFGQLQPAEDHTHFITDNKTLGMHESVSRFYENRIGRSEAFIELIYPKVKEIFPEAMENVSSRELYEALNIAEPSLIRTEADELTYTMHIIIRYELEKLIVEKKVSIGDLPRLWAEKYQSFLGVSPSNDAEGILQDVHWSSGFGYFPTYALGNMYNAMYYNRMKEDLDIDREIRSGNLAAINRWMTDHVFARADRLDPMDWLQEITGRSFSPDDFLDYLEEKYTKLYELD